MKQLKSSEPDRWEGYSLDRLAYERAVTMARIVIERRRVTEDFSRLREGNVMLSRRTFGRLLSLVSFTDMFVMGVKLIRTVYPLFRKRR